MRRDGRCHDSMGTYRTRAQSAVLKEAVLEAWSTGELAIPIGERLGIDHTYVSAIVRRARKAGDARAVRRPLFKLPPGGRALSRKRLALSDA